MDFIPDDEGLMSTNSRVMLSREMMSETASDMAEVGDIGEDGHEDAVIKLVDASCDKLAAIILIL